MKTNILMVIILALFFNSCKSTSNKTNPSDDKQRLEGEWTLDYVNYPQQNLQELYSFGIPSIRFDITQNTVSGNNGCNMFSGKFEASGNTISFKGPMTATKRYCEGKGESVFMENLNKAESFSISKDGKTLEFTEKKVLLMRFIKK